HGPSLSRRAPGDFVLVEVAVDGLVRRLDDLLGRREVGHALVEVDAVILVVDPGHLPDHRLREALHAPGDHDSTTSRSMGSTLIPCWRSQATPSSSFSCGASSSSTIQPWSSRTSARRMFGTMAKSFTRR